MNLNFNLLHDNDNYVKYASVSEYQRRALTDRSLSCLDERHLRGSDPALHSFTNLDFLHPLLPVSVTSWAGLPCATLKSYLKVSTSW